MAGPIPNVVGLDVGGANLKYVVTTRWPKRDPNRQSSNPAISRFFPMWQRHLDLAAQTRNDLQELRRECGQIDAVAVTMTGELADCFADRAEGVHHIVSHVCEAADDMGINQIAFYGVDGKFRGAIDAIRNEQLVAAANWHALAKFVSCTIGDDGMLIDVGSTTTDIVPFAGSQVVTNARTDYQRLMEGSLVYIGGRRTPVATLVSEVEHRGHQVPVMKEAFATMDDVRLVLDLVDQDPQDFDTTDGKPRLIEMSVNRLARMIGLDHRHFDQEDAVSMARQIHAVARGAIAQAHRGVAELHNSVATVVVSGHADDLIEIPPDTSVIRLSDQLGPDISRCAPAYAVALLLPLVDPKLRERCDA